MSIMIYRDQGGKKEGYIQQFVLHQDCEYAHKKSIIIML